MSTTASASRLATLPRPAITYAQARLWLGICCVGFQVLFAITALATGLPERLVPVLTERLQSTFLATFALFLLLAATLLPFDVFGGYILPRRFTRTAPAASLFAFRLLRGIFVQVAVFTASFVLYGWLGAVWGTAAVLTAFAGTQLILIAVQSQVARWTGGLRTSERVPSSEAAVLHSDDAGFTGGITGLPGWDRVVIPDSWSETYSDEVYRTAVRRRQLIVTSGLRRRGVIAAVGWNTMLLAVALWLPGGGGETLVALTNSFLYFALLSFGGLLLLPVLSRRAVFAADRLTAEHLAAEHGGAALIAQLAAHADQVPEGEPLRSVQKESVFHPVPCGARRTAALESAATTTSGFWNVARTVLFCSWAFGGPLSRSVHCNIGRPDLWVLLPTD